MPKFRLPGLPTEASDSPVEIADWWEIVALKSRAKRASLNDLRSIRHRETETDAETDAEEDIAEESKFDFAIDEIRYRCAACGKSYPFRLGGKFNRVLEFQGSVTVEARLLYIFLLLTTRLNMNTRRQFNKIDGTLLFEEVCEIALKSIWSERAKIHRFGTSSGQGNFPQKLEAFFKDLQESGLRKDRKIRNHGGDDGVDLAMWSSFTWIPENNSRPPQGKLILLAQCKTGTSWEVADLQRLQPNSFFAKWASPVPCGQTVRAFMASARIDQCDWEDHHRDGGLLFDRCRIFDYAAGRLPSHVFSKVELWTEGAMACSDLGYS